MEHAKKERKKYSLSRGESASEPDLVGRTGESRAGRVGYPPGFTVDKLRFFRKKKPPGPWQPKDNLKSEGGSMKKFKSEYVRCFKSFKFLPSSNEDLSTADDEVYVEHRSKPEDFLKLEGPYDYRPEYKRVYTEYPIQRQVLVKPKALLGLVEGSVDVKSEQHERYIPFLSMPRAQLTRRASSLQREGEFIANSSEMHSQYVKHDDVKRAELTRRPTSLRLEGEILSTSETAEKFIQFLMERRPALSEAPSNLKLEGKMDTTSEQNEKYIPFNISKRIPLPKQETNLRLEGTMDIQSEKQEKFVPFNIQKRPMLAKRDTNLHLEGDMLTRTEKQDKFVPFNLEKRTILAKRDTNLHFEGDMNTQTEKSDKYIQHEPQKRPPLARKDTNLLLQGDLIISPEYREVYIEYPSERQKAKRPVNNLGLNYDETDPTKLKDNFFSEYQKPYRNSDPHFEAKPIYKENFVQHDFEKTILKKPKENLKPEGPLDLITESQVKFKGHAVSRPLFKRLPDNLQLEGDLEISPEYRNEFVDFSSRKVGRPAAGKVPDEGRLKRTRNQPEGHLKSEGKMEGDAEYRSSYVEFPRSRPIIKRPPNSIKTEGDVLHITEKGSKFIEHAVQARPPLARREDELKMDDRLECQPEYRKAYIDLLRRENPTRKPRTYDTLYPSLQRAFDVMSSEESSVQEKAKSIPQREPQKSSRQRPSKPELTGKSRSVSPDRRRKTRQVPRTPKQERVLVPDISGLSPRRPSSIFGPKINRWQTRAYSPSAQQTQYVEEDSEETSSSNPRDRECSQSSRRASRWHSPCERRDDSQCCAKRDCCCGRKLTRIPSPSPPRRDGWSKEEYVKKQEEEPSASFVVLKDREVNNNRVDGKEAGRCCKEQKWMKPWYDPLA